MKAFLIIAIAGLLVFAGVAAWKLSDLMSTNPEAIHISLPQLIKPPSLAEQLEDRAVECTEENRAAFLAEAGGINDAFQDKFRLALGTSRIALSNVIGDMQDLSRELEQVQADPCGKIVQEHMGKAYGMAIDAFLDFMSQRTEGEEIYGLGWDMQLEMGYWGAYDVALVGPILAADLSALTELDAGSETEVPPELEYLALFDKDKLNCVDAKFLQQILNGVFTATRNNFDTLGLSELESQTTPVTPTPVPCTP